MADRSLDSERKDLRPSYSERKDNCTRFYLVYNCTHHLDKTQHQTETSFFDTLEAVFLRQTDAENFILLWLQDLDADDTDIFHYVKDVSLGDQQYIGQPHFGEETKMPLPLSMIYRDTLTGWWNLTQRDGANRLNGPLADVFGTFIDDDAFIAGYVDESTEYDSCLPIYVVYGKVTIHHTKTTGRDETLHTNIYDSVYEHVGGIYITLDEAKARANYMITQEPGMFEEVTIVAVNKMTIPKKEPNTQGNVWIMNGIDDIDDEHGAVYKLVSES